MSTVNQMFSIRTIKKMRDNAWLSYKEEAEVPVLVDAATDSVVLGVGVAVGNAFSISAGVEGIYLTACEGVLHNLLLDTYEYYKDLYDFMVKYDFDAVKLDFGYKMVYFKPQRGWEGGYLPTQNDIPTDIAFHRDGGWITA